MPDDKESQEDRMLKHVMDLVNDMYKTPASGAEKKERLVAAAEDTVNKHLIPKFESLLMQNFISYSVLALTRDLLLRASIEQGIPPASMRDAYLECWKKSVEIEMAGSSLSESLQKQFTALAEDCDLNPADLPDLSNFADSMLEEFCNTKIKLALHIDV
jgi:hypothetical protein